MTEEPIDWIQAQADVVSHETVVSTPRSTVIRCATRDGDLYFKADHILPPPECVVVSRIAGSRPALVPEIVATDEVRGWSLTRDAGRQGLLDAETHVWCDVARAFADVQRNSGATADEWRNLGCRDLRGMRLLDAIDSMVAGAESDLSSEERERLGEKRGRVEAACRALAEDAVPAQLVHQDLVPVNIVFGATGPVFIDWSDTVVGHPFFGFDRLLDSCWTDAERKAAVIDAYLSGFDGVDSEEGLRASFAHVLSLRVLYECVRWHHELAEIEPGTRHAVAMRADMLVGLRLVAR